MVIEFCSALNGLHEIHMKALRTPRNGFISAPARVNRGASGANAPGPPKIGARLST